MQSARTTILRGHDALAFDRPATRGMRLTSPPAPRCASNRGRPQVELVEIGGGRGYTASPGG
ncbi:hypothetical protein [Pseudomonas aeruginosa]|uniref:hypothetical protein n=1 Tax=Pseudomonas aeruginosa TaxID=287 RepID=UPI003857E68E